jgi:hypothetical protein
VPRPTLMVGGVLLAPAIRRTSARLRPVGIGYAVLMAAFAVADFIVPALQPIAAAALVVVTIAIPSRWPPASRQRCRWHGSI